MEGLSVKKIEGRSCKENGGATGKTAKQRINLSALQLQQPWQSLLGAHCPQGGSWGVSRGDSWGFRPHIWCGNTGTGQKHQAGEWGKRFLTGAASGGHLGLSRTAGSFAFCPTPCSSPPGGLSSAPRWLQRGTMGDEGSGCASSSTSGGKKARQAAKLLLLQAPRPLFAGSPSIPSTLGAPPTFSTPQDHPKAPSAAKETNTGQRGSSLPSLPFLPAYQKHQHHTSRDSSVAADDWDDWFLPRDIWGRREGPT